MSLLTIPPELLEKILLQLDLLDVAALSQTCSALYAYIYASPDEHLWRSLYLLTPLDDLRACLDSLGFPLPPTAQDWKSRLQATIRARTLIADPAKCHPVERPALLHTLRFLTAHTPPLPHPFSDRLSCNLAWLAAHLGTGSFFTHALWAEPTAEECQALAELHAAFGLTDEDLQPAALVASRALVYDMRRYTARGGWGPFRHDGSGRVDWVHVQAIHHVMAMNLNHARVASAGQQARGGFKIHPMSLPYCQSIVPEGLDLDRQDDWAGVTGVWQCFFAFIDHGDLIYYNNGRNVRGDKPLDTALFESPDFYEAFESISVEFSVVEIAHDRKHPTRPVIHFKGTLASGDYPPMQGTIRVTPDNHVRWHFTSGEGEDDETVWSCEGVQIGGVRSSYGVLGAWTSIHHDQLDPVGPFWLRKGNDNADDFSFR